MRKKYESSVLASVHEAAADFAAVGLIDQKTMRQFDELCLTSVETLTPEKIREIRSQENVSQAVFARHLNVTPGLVSQWERGEKKPSGASLKLLTLVKSKGLAWIS